MKKSKVIILSWECYPIYVGGLGVLVESLATEITAQGREVEVWIPHKTDGYEMPPYVHSLYKRTQYFKRKKAMVEDVDLPLHFPQEQKLQPWPKLFAEHQSTKTAPRLLYKPVTFPGDFMAFSHSVAERMKEEDPNTTIIHMDYHQVPSMMLLKKQFPHLKHIFYINSIEQDRKAGKVKSNKCQKIIAMERLGFDQADLSVVVSQITKDIILQHHDIDGSRMHVVYNDIRFKPEIIPHHQIDSGKNVLFIGRLTTQKGLNFLIDAAEHMREIDKSIKCIVAGDGPQLPQLVERVAKKGLEKTILFTGFVNTQEKKLLYRSCDIFVMPSPTEPFGLTALEAIRSGMPVIASNRCGFVGVVPSTPTFDYHDSGRFMELLLCYLNNPSQKGALLKQQQNDLKSHSWTGEVTKLLGIIDSLEAKTNPKVKDTSTNKLHRARVLA